MSKLTPKQRVDRIHAALHHLDEKANVAAFVVLNPAGAHAATVRFSFPRDGAGKLQCLAADWLAPRPLAVDSLPDFETWTPWQYGCASGCGYDKCTAAMSGMTIGGCKIHDGGERWDSQLRAAGYTVIQAV